MAERVIETLDRSRIGFRERVALCTTTHDIFQLTKQVAGEYNYRFFTVARLPTSKDTELGALLLLDNWPKELLRIYDEQGMLGESPIYDALKASTKPVVWSNRPNSKHLLKTSTAEKREVFRSFGVCNGVHFSVQGPDGQRGAISLSGDRSPPSEAELADLSYFANLVYERLWELKKTKKTGQTQALSTRENECLMWTASGKTSAEIAIILKLSEHTVNHYLTAACQKLGATNRAHAVYKAMRAGYLH